MGLDFKKEKLQRDNHGVEVRKREKERGWNAVNNELIQSKQNKVIL